MRRIVAIAAVTLLAAACGAEEETVSEDMIPAAETTAPVVDVAPPVDSMADTMMVDTMMVDTMGAEDHAEAPGTGH